MPRGSARPCGDGRGDGRDGARARAKSVEQMYEVIAVHPATGKVTRFAVAAKSHYEARRHAESCGLEHVVVEGPEGGGDWLPDSGTRENAGAQGASN